MQIHDMELQIIKESKYAMMVENEQGIHRQGKTYIHIIATTLNQSATKAYTIFYT